MLSQPVAVPLDALSVARQVDHPVLPPRVEDLGDTASAWPKVERELLLLVPIPQRGGRWLRGVARTVEAQRELSAVPRGHGDERVRPLNGMRLPSPLCNSGQKSAGTQVGFKNILG